MFSIRKRYNSRLRRNLPNLRTCLMCDSCDGPRLDNGDYDYYQYTKNSLKFNHFQTIEKLKNLENSKPKNLKLFLYFILCLHFHNTNVKIWNFVHVFEKLKKLILCNVSANWV